MEDFSTDEILSARTELEPNLRIAQAAIQQLPIDDPPEYEIIVTERRFSSPNTLRDGLELPYVSRTFRMKTLRYGLPDILNAIRDDSAFDEGFKSQLREVVRRVVFAVVDAHRKRESSE